MTDFILHLMSNMAAVVLKIGNTIVNLLLDAVVLFLNLFTKVVVFILDEVIDQTEYLNEIFHFTDILPDDVLNIMSLVGFGACVKVVMTAVALKILLQLIPGTRLGSK